MHKFDMNMAVIRNVFVTLDQIIMLSKLRVKILRLSRKNKKITLKRTGKPVHNTKGVIIII